MASIGFILTVVAAIATAGTTASVDWISHNGDYDESAYSGLSQISKTSIKRLGLAWSLDLPGEVSLEATPLAVNGHLFFTGSYSDVYAVNASDGHLLWKFDAQIWNHHPAKMRTLFGANRGVAYLDGKVFAATLDGRLLALDAKTGLLLWSVETVDSDSVQTSTGAPRAFGNMVLIGNSGADYGMRGYVTAYDARSGRQLWRFYTVPSEAAKNGNDPAMALAAKTWSGDWWKVSGGGGTVWDSITYDARLGRVYLGVGNSGPYNPAVRSPGGGDNLFLASIVALDARTGKYLWHYQVNPREAWDYKATQNMIEATLTIDGKKREVLMQSPTNGFFYVLDRQNGKLISADKTGKVTWAERIDLASGRPIEQPNIRYETGSVTMWPSPFGTHNWQSMSYSPITGLTYIPYMQLGAKFTLQIGSLTGGVGIEPVFADAEDGQGALLAWDPVAKKTRWKVQHKAFWNGGTLVTRGGLVFQGDGDGEFAAYDADSGRKLWYFNAGLGIIAAPISYSVGPTQYVSLLVGYGGATSGWSSIGNRGWKFGAQPRRLLTFALDGVATLPPTAAPDYGVQALDDPDLKLDPVRIKAGATTYTNCFFCHGAHLESAGVAPDLRQSQVALNLNALRSVLHGGSLRQMGMPKFDNLTDEDIQNLYMYIRAGSREAISKEDALKSTPAPNNRF